MTTDPARLIARSEREEQETVKVLHEAGSRLRCVACGTHDNRVLWTRLRKDGVVWRRHQCQCGQRFSSEQRIKTAA